MNNYGGGGVFKVIIASTDFVTATSFFSFRDT